MANPTNTLAIYMLKSKQETKFKKIMKIHEKLRPLVVPKNLTTKWFTVKL